MKRQTILLRLKNRKHKLERASVERKFLAFSSFGGHVLSPIYYFFFKIFEKENFFPHDPFSPAFLTYAWSTHAFFPVELPYVHIIHSVPIHADPFCFHNYLLICLCVQSLSKVEPTTIEKNQSSLRFIPLSSRFFYISLSAHWFFAIKLWPPPQLQELRISE